MNVFLIKKVKITSSSLVFFFFFSFPLLIASVYSIAEHTAEHESCA